MVRGRRIHACAGDELPALLAGGGIEGVNRVTIDRGDEDTARRNGWLRQFAPERDFPLLLEPARDFRFAVRAAPFPVGLP